MQLNPSESWTVVRQLEDPFDSTTYYVRAVIRNAKTDVVLETLDLTDQTSQRFTKTWLTPADVSGQGFWIDIKTTVYTDSGYTTKSENYGELTETNLIQQRYNFNPNYPIPVGPDIDYKRIRKIAKEEAEKAVASIEIEVPEAKVVTVENKTVKEVMVEYPSFDPILAKLKEILMKPEPKKDDPVDLSPVIDLIKEIKTLKKEEMEEMFESLAERLPKDVVVSPYQKDTRVRKLIKKPLSDRVKKLL